MDEELELEDNLEFSEGLEISEVSFINNKDLFSTHYLAERAPKSDLWESKTDIKEKFKEIKEEYEKEKDNFEHYNEAQLEDNFIKPVLEILGRTFEPQQKTQESLIPDYSFYRSEEDRSKAIKKDDRYQNAIAVGDAKAWDLNLDQRTKSGKVKYHESNPSWQIMRYLKRTTLDWGILTNGKKWRIYYKDKSDKLDIYYEVNLIEILKENNLEAFKYFYHVFKQEAFLEDSTGKKPLDRLYDKSIRYRKSVGKELEDRVYKALKWMIDGYFSVGTNKLNGKRLKGNKNEEMMQEVYENSLIFLYRLLFVLYAESRGLLGEQDKLPSSKSIIKAIDDILDDLDNDNIEENDATYSWRLNNIFELVDKGSDHEDFERIEAEVPAYDGGLFDNDKYPFFKQREAGKTNKILDKELAKVIDLIARRKEDGEKVRIDYSDLSIRHIGGIYEGLLEHKPQLKDGEVELLTDKGERKKTGSYYTPDYIVEYIVENTVEPVIEEKLSEIDEDLPEKEERKAKREAILSIDVLDPAMGSGHFLIGALEKLAKELAPYLEEERVGEEENDIDVAKRLVVKNCLYGVDVNPLATELARVSLWLNTISPNKPLPFLNHHIKTGNSLIGAELEDLGRHPEETEKNSNEEPKKLADYIGMEESDKLQSNLKELLNKFNEINNLRENGPDDIKKEKDIYNQYLDSEFRKSFDVLADVHTSFYFGNEYCKKDYQKLLDAFQEDTENWEEMTKKEWVKKATDSVKNPKENNLSEQKNFFHWKLEFPEVFFDTKTGTEKQNPGFDVAIGNPPWIESKNIPSKLGRYLSNKYSSIKGQYDIFNAFIEKITKFSKNKCGFIIPERFLSNDDYKSLRKYLINETSPTEIYSQGDNVFEGVNMPSLIFIWKPGSGKNDNILVKINKNSFTNPKCYEIPINRFKRDDDYIFSIYTTPKERSISEKMESSSVKLEKIVDNGRGVEIGKRSPLISSDPEEFDVPFLVGEDIGRYKIKRKRSLKLGEGDVDYKDEELYKAPKILLRKTGKGLNGVIDYSDSYVIQVIYIFKKKSNLEKPLVKCSEEYILGILNSKLMNFYYFSKFGEKNKQTFPHLRQGQVLDLPIKPPQKPKNNIHQFSKRLHNLNSSKREETSEFLDWIESEWDVDIDNLSLKTHLREYWEYDFDEFMRIAKKNKSKVDGDVRSRKFRELMKKEWENSMDTLRPLMKEINELENEIDAIVFDLYDLTEDEVETVLDSLETPEKEKKDIIEKFRGLGDG